MIIPILEMFCFLTLFVFAGSAALLRGQHSCIAIQFDHVSHITGLLYPNDHTAHSSAAPARCVKHHHFTMCAAEVFTHTGCDTLIVTNAAGGINPAYSVGDVMIMKVRCAWHAEQQSSFHRRKMRFSSFVSHLMLAGPHQFCRDGRPKRPHRLKRCAIYMCRD